MVNVFYIIILLYYTDQNLTVLDVRKSERRLSVKLYVLTSAFVKDFTINFQI